MTRKTLTLKPEHVLGIKDLHPADRLLVYDTIINGFLLGEEINYSQYPDTAKTALALLIPQLRKLQSQFNNGLKNKPTKITAPLCPFDDIQNNPNTSTSTHACQLDNINIRNNIYNTNQTTACAGTRVRGNYTKNNDDGTAAVKNKPSTPEQITVKKLLEQLQTVKTIKINGMPTPTAKVALQIEKFLDRDDSVSLLKQFFTELRANPDIKHKNKYLIATIYNTETRLQHAVKQYTQTKPFIERTYYKGYMEHTYDKDLINSVFSEP